MILVATGHRPGKLGGYGPQVTARINQLALAVLTHHIEKGPEPIEVVVCGMALGWDQAIAYAAFQHCLPLHAVIPYRGFQQRWPSASRRRYERLREQAQWVEHIDDREAYQLTSQEIRHALLRRNEVMLEYLKGDLGAVIALYDGQEGGGTYHAVRKARAQGLRVINYWSSWVKNKNL